MAKGLHRYSWNQWSFNLKIGRLFWVSSIITWAFKGERWEGWKPEKTGRQCDEGCRAASMNRDCLSWQQERKGDLSPIATNNWVLSITWLLIAWKQVHPKASRKDCVLVNTLIFVFVCFFFFWETPRDSIEPCFTCETIKTKFLLFKPLCFGSLL